MSSYEPMETENSAEAARATKVSALTLCLIMPVCIWLLTRSSSQDKEQNTTTTIDPDLVTSTQETPLVGESDDYSEIN